MDEDEDEHKPPVVSRGLPWSPVASRGPPVVFRGLPWAPVVSRGPPWARTKSGIRCLRGLPWAPVAPRGSETSEKKEEKDKKGNS